MVFSFSNLPVLLLIPAVCVFTIFFARRNLKLKGWRQKAALALRLAVLTLLILSISGFGIKRTSNQTTSIFVIDGSDSTLTARERINSFVREALKHKKLSDKAGIVNFGSNAAVEVSPSERIQFQEAQTLVDGNFTDIAEGLRLAASLIPAESRKRVVLVTDGLENSGDALKQARIMQRQGIVLDIFPVETLQKEEVQLKELIVPKSSHLNEKLEIVARVDSTVRTRGTLKLYKDRELAAQMEVDIQEGENNFVFSDVASREGLVTYSAVIEAHDDTITLNNRMWAFCDVGDAARILVVQDDDEGAKELIRILEEDVEVTVKRPENLPVSVEELQKYDAFIISNVSAEKLDDRFLASLETCIKHQGKGLLVTGGDNSYAPGGYYGTILERILPVDMNINPKQEMPNLGLVLVIDKSGSMSDGQYGTSKIELAKEAAIRSTEVLNQDDMIGIIAFDSAVQWVVKTRKPDDLKRIQDAIGTIRASGGTQILPALQEAYNSLKEADTKLKHIILLTDGQAEKTGYESLLREMNQAGITLSTVAVGSEADSALLKALALGGNGRFYMTDVFTDIPKIFAKETFLAGKTYLNNRTFTPSLKAYSDMIKGIESIPVLDGYVGTTPKGTATVIFASDTDDPILASWQYGLGRTVAWTSDARGMWTSAWMQWDESPQFWKNVISWVMQEGSPEDYNIDTGIMRGKGYIELTFPPDKIGRGEKVEALIAGPDGTEQAITLEPVSPGVFKGTFDAGETGVYIANIAVKDENETVENINTGIVVPYSPEYEISREDPLLFLEKLAAEGGGRIIRDGSEVFSDELPEVSGIRDMVPVLLQLAILLFLADIAVRRLRLPINRVKELLSDTFGRASGVIRTMGSAAIKGAVVKGTALRRGKTKGGILKENVETGPALSKTAAEGTVLKEEALKETAAKGTVLRETGAKETSLKEKAEQKAVLKGVKVKGSTTAVKGSTIKETAPEQEAAKKTRSDKPRNKNQNDSTSSLSSILLEKKRRRGR